MIEYSSIRVLLVLWLTYTQGFAEYSASPPELFNPSCQDLTLFPQSFVAVLSWTVGSRSPSIGGNIKLRCNYLTSVKKRRRATCRPVQ